MKKKKASPPSPAQSRTRAWSECFARDEPLIYAVLMADYETVQSLLRMGFDPNTREQTSYEHHKTALMLSIAQKPLLIAKLLLEHGANVKLRDDYGQTALIAAVYSGRTEAVMLLIDHGAEINVHDMNGATPLSVAVSTANPDMVQLLLEKGAAVKPVSDEAGDPLESAEAMGLSAIAALLREYASRSAVS